MSRPVLSALVLAAVLACASATTTTWGGATRVSSLKTSTAGGNLMFWFQPGADVAIDAFVTLTASEAIFAATTTTTCTSTSNNAVKAVDAATATTSTTVLKVKMDAALTANKVAVITCTDNLADNGATAQAVTFQITAGSDTAIATAQTGYTLVAATSPTWVSAAVLSPAVGLAPGALTATFKPNTAIATTGVVTLTSSVAIWTADAAATSCSMTTPFTNGNGAVTAGATLAATLVESITPTSSTVSGTQTIIKIVVGQLLTLGYDTVITCTSNLAVNPAAQAITFSLATTTDLTTITGQTGYTTLADQATPSFGVSRATSLVASTASAGVAAGNLVFGFTPLKTIAAAGLVTLTASEAIFTAGAPTDTTCTATCGGVAVALTAADTEATSTTALNVKFTAACSGATVVTCTDNLANSGTTAQAVTFTLKTPVSTGTAGIPGYTLVAANSVTWVSGVRDNGVYGQTGYIYKSGYTAGNLVVTFIPNVGIASGKAVVITPSQNIFTADAATTCTCTNGGVTKTVTSSATVGAVLTVTMGAAVSVGFETIITCASNLAANGAAGAVTFGIYTEGATTADNTVALTGQTGYTITPANATATANNDTSTGTTTGTYSIATTTITTGYTYAVSTATNFGNLVGCAYAKVISDSTNSLSADMCVASSGLTFTYKTGASSTNTVADARRTSTVAVALKMYHSYLSQPNAEAAVTQAGTTVVALNTAIAAMNIASGAGFSATDIVATSMTPATWTHSSAAVVVPSMMAMFSALLLLVLMQ